MKRKMSISERFWKNRRNNIYRGPSYTMFKGLKMPSHEQMDRMDKYKLIYDIDPEIREMILELNSKGFKTLGSCAGHMPNKRHGFVSIEGKATKHKIEIVREILKKYGLSDVRFGNQHEIFWSMRFKSVGLRELRDRYKHLEKYKENGETKKVKER